MIDDLLERIERYRERVNEFHRRKLEENWQREADEEEYDDDWDEDLNEGKSENEELTSLDPALSGTISGGLSGRLRKAEADDKPDFWDLREDEVFFNIYLEEPDEVSFDENDEIIEGHMLMSRYSFDLYHDTQTKPLRYMVSPDNPWYFDIDGVVFSKETGLLVLFPPGKGEEYTIPDDDRITGIGENAFAANAILKRINLGSKVLYIGDKAFAQCAALQEICLPSQVEYVGSRVLADCISLERAEIQCKINVIPNRIFLRDAALRSIVLPNGIETIGLGAFEECSALNIIRTCTAVAAEGEAVFPDVSVIGSDAFSGCVSIRVFKLDKAKEYKAHCFRNCTGLESITFGSATVKLGKELLLGADHLKTIRFSCAPGCAVDSDALPEDVQYILDTEAYLNTSRPYSNRVLFLAATENLASGQPASPNAVSVAVRTLKRNRKKLYDFFLKDERILDWTLEQGVLDITDCTAMLHKTNSENLQLADMIRNYITRMFTETAIRCAEEAFLTEEKKRLEREEQARRIQEITLQKAETIRANLPEGLDISLEEMDLSIRAYNCMKRAGYNYLSEIAVLSHDDMMKVRNLGLRSIVEIKEKVEALTGLKLPDE